MALSDIKPSSCTSSKFFLYATKMFTRFPLVALQGVMLQEHNPSFQTKQPKMSTADNAPWKVHLHGAIRQTKMKQKFERCCRGESATGLHFRRFRSNESGVMLSGATEMPTGNTSTCNHPPGAAKVVVILIIWGLYGVLFGVIGGGLNLFGNLQLGRPSIVFDVKAVDRVFRSRRWCL